MHLYQTQRRLFGNLLIAITVAVLVAAAITVAPQAHAQGGGASDAQDETTVEDLLDPSVPEALTARAGTPADETAATLSESPMAAPDNSEAGSRRSVDDPDSDVYPHYSRAIVPIQHDKWDSELTGGETITHFTIFRRYLHNWPNSDHDTAPHVVRERMPASSGSVTILNDYDVASRVHYVYYVEPITSGRNRLTFKKTGVVKTSSRRSIEGRGTATGTEFYIIPWDSETHTPNQQSFTWERYGYTLATGSIDRLREYRSGQIPFPESILSIKYATATDTLAAGTFKAYKVYLHARSTGEVVVPFDPDTSFAKSGRHVIRAGAHTPSGVQNLTGEVVDSNVLLDWTRPGINYSEVAQYEILRSSYLPSAGSHWSRIGTTKKTRFKDTFYVPHRTFSKYKIVVITKAGDRIDAGLTIRVPEQFTAPVCRTDSGNHVTVVRINMEPNILYGPDGTGKDGQTDGYGVIDTWLYGEGTGGHPERCNSWDYHMYELQKELYYHHGLDDDCDPPERSCDIEDETPGEGVVTVLATPSLNLGGGHRNWFARYYDLLGRGPSTFTKPGVYGYRYRVCSVYDSPPLCSPWRDMGERKVLVAKKPYTELDILPSSHVPLEPFPSNNGVFPH